MPKGTLRWTEDGRVEVAQCDCGFAIEFVPPTDAETAVDRIADHARACRPPTIRYDLYDGGYCDVCKGPCQGH